jgi:hypothetical protein
MTTHKQKQQRSEGVTKLRREEKRVRLRVQVRAFQKLRLLRAMRGVSRSTDGSLQVSSDLPKCITL